MKTKKTLQEGKRTRYFLLAFLLCNVIAIAIIYHYEDAYINNALLKRSVKCQDGVEEVMDNYTHSFQLFSKMLQDQINAHENPDDIWNYLKTLDKDMQLIEGDTYDGLYMYYQGRYLYSWDTPYSQYESTGYVATQRPWYINAQNANNEIVFTPPYMSYANHYILSTISQMQADNETVFAYDIKMGDIQKLVKSDRVYSGENMMIFDNNGTIIGSSNENYLGGNLTSSLSDSEKAMKEAAQAVKNAKGIEGEELDKLKEQFESAKTFYTFKKKFYSNYETLAKHDKVSKIIDVDGKHYYAMLQQGKQYSYIILVPIMSMLTTTMQVWLLPLLLVELLLIYIISHIGKEIRNRELHNAYVELGQTQRRLEIALSAAQKAAAIDELTGMMNMKSFRKAVNDHLAAMEENEYGILIMIDGDHFKTVNDDYGHAVGDEVIRLSAQMIVGRIRTIDYASRLHGDEFAIFITNTNDYAVAKNIMDDINHTLAKEAKKRNMPSITMSSGAVIAKANDDYTTLAKLGDEALYKAKETHDGGFCSYTKD